jgi:hypothetical protein
VVESPGVVKDKMRMWQFDSCWDTKNPGPSARSEFIYSDDGARRGAISAFAGNVSQMRAATGQVRSASKRAPPCEKISLRPP